MYKPAIASMALGRASVHSLPAKFAAAASAGLPAIEMFYEDLEELAASYNGGATPSNLRRAAHSIADLARSLDLEIMALGPFSNVDGVVGGEGARDEKLEEVRVWFDLARIMGTDLIQIPSTYLADGSMTGDMEVIVADLRAVADLGAEQTPPFRFAYENLSFATFNDSWEKAWEVVRAVDRENFGLCLDTFNIAGRGWADPASEEGRLENADEVFRRSLERMVREVDVRKVFYVQVVDAERLSGPLDERHPFYVEGQRPRMSWSRNARLFLGETDRGGYLPVWDVLKVICDGLGYEGWISAELFNRSLLEKDESVPRRHADRCVESWKKIVKHMGWENRVESRWLDSAPEDNVHVQSQNGAANMEETEIMARL